MSRGAQNVKQGDIAKALKAARSAGVDVQRFEIDPTTGKIVIFAGKPDDPEKAKPGNEWDSIQ